MGVYITFSCDMASKSAENFQLLLLHVEMVIKILYSTNSTGQRLKVDRLHWRNFI